MYNLIELTKNYFFCSVCGKCYIYKGSYEKHKLNCIDKNENNDKNNNNIEQNIIIKNKTFNKESLYNNNSEFYTNKIIKKEELYSHSKKLQINHLNRNEFVLHIICPFYLFFCSLLLGMIKLIIYGE